jgi:cardiolipin synthase A/B
VRSSFSRWLAALVSAALVAAGCASLPAFDRLQHGAGSAHTLSVRSARAGLSEERTEVILAKLGADGRSNLLQRHLAFMEGASDLPLVKGNTARLLVDGPATHEAMFEAIRAAREHIHLESYIIEDDPIGRRLAELLIAKRAAGVEVRVLYDSVGTIGTPNSYFDRLSEAGIHVCEFNPVNPLKVSRYWRINHRDHRKVLVIDGKLAFTGGINISAVYSGGSFGRRRASAERGWRDTHIAMEGPAVTDFQRLFLETWDKQRCEPPISRPYVRELTPAGDKLVRVIGGSADDEINQIYVAFLSAITHAQRSIHLTMAYFVPDPQTLEALKNAAKRGVDVQLVLPGFSDFWAVFHAGRSHYSELLRAGVKIYERRNALLHAKTAVIDGVWSTVGSSNIDLRSFLHNEELNAVVLGAEFGSEMEELFRRDLAESHAIDPQRWAARSPALRLKENFARVWEYWL